MLAYLGYGPERRAARPAARVGIFATWVGWHAWGERRSSCCSATPTSPPETVAVRGLYEPADATSTPSRTLRILALPAALLVPTGINMSNAYTGTESRRVSRSTSGPMCAQNSFGSKCRGIRRTLEPWSARLRRESNLRHAERTPPRGQRIFRWCTPDTGAWTVRACLPAKPGSCFIGLTTKKKMAAAISTNKMIALMNAP